MTEPATQPTPEEIAATQRVGAAAGEAAAGAETAQQAREEATRAARAAADREGLVLSDADVKRVVDAFVSALEVRGAFDPPPEPVVAPPTAPPAPTQGDAAAAAPAPVDSTPKKRTFAQKFLGE